MTSEGIKIVENGTNITKSFCDLTDVQQDMWETYIPMVKGLRVKTFLILCMGDITTMKMSQEPPDFETVGFADHINVAVQFSPLAPKIHEEELHDHKSLVLNEHSEDNEKRYEAQLNGNFSGNFSDALTT